MQHSARLELRLTDAELAVFDASAVHAGLSLSAWVRAACNAAASPAPSSPARAVQAGPVAAPASSPPVVPSIPAVAAIPSPWRQLCPDCARRGGPSCVSCRLRNGLAV
jgi:hypothetical protein